MATRQPDKQSLVRFLIENVKETGRTLGEGSYGTVVELEANGVVCAGKTLHANLVDPGYIGVESFIETYLKECQLMSDLRHPHLVQFLGVSFLPHTASSSYPCAGHGEDAYQPS